MSELARTNRERFALEPLSAVAPVAVADLSRPSQEEVEATTERTKNALAALVSGAVASQKPKTISVNTRREATYVAYTPSSQMAGRANGAGAGTTEKRILRIQEKQRDPMEPPKFKHKKIPGRPPSPPAVQMHSPPRKLTAEDQKAWRIPPPVSNWKNPKGFTVPLDKRLAADGRGLQDVQINDKFAAFSEALFMADRHAREEVRQRAMMQQRLADKEKAQKEDHLRQLAQQVRSERAAGSGGAGGRRRRSSSRSGSDYSRSGSDSEDSEYERRQARKDRQREEERKMRQTRMGTERRAQVMAREMDRDISEKIALGLAKPTMSGESMYDSRLFNQTGGMATGFNEDNPYDKPLFAAQEAVSSIYRPRASAADDEDDDDGAGEMARIQKAGKSRFGDALGRSGTFKGAAEAEAREGPVQFERNKDAGSSSLDGGPKGAEDAELFNVDKFLSEVEQSSSGAAHKKRGYGIHEGGNEARQPKRPKVDDDDDD